MFYICWLYGEEIFLLNVQALFTWNCAGSQKINILFTLPLYLEAPMGSQNPIMLGTV